MQTVLEQGSIDKPLTFDVGLIQLSFIPVCSLNTCKEKERKYHSFKCTMCTHNVTNEMKNKCNTFELLTSLGQQDTSTMCWAWQGRK